MGEIERLIAMARARIAALPKRVIVTHNAGTPKAGPAWFHSDNRDKPYMPKAGDILFDGKKIGEATDLKFKFPEMQDIVFNGIKIGEVDKNLPNFSFKVATMIGRAIRESRRDPTPFSFVEKRKPRTWSADLPLGRPRPPLKGTTDQGFATGGFVRGPIKGKDEVQAWLTGEWSKPMSYNYREQRPNIFTDDGQRMFLTVRDNAKALLAKSGAATMDKLVSGLTGDSWHHMACVDRMVELNELREVHNSLSGAGQHRLFIAPL